MKHLARLVLLFGTIIFVEGAGNRNKSVESNFFEKWREGRMLEKGQNLRLTSDQTASSLLSKLEEGTASLGSFVGVGLNIRNQSPFKLAEPETYQQQLCGHQVSILQVYSVSQLQITARDVINFPFQENGTYIEGYRGFEVNPGVDDVFLFHNGGNSGCCGAVAWQVKS